MALTKELVDRLFEYREGKLYWKERISKSVKIGDHVGTIRGKTNTHKGYWATRINEVNVYNHLIVFLMHNDYIPEAIRFANSDTLDYRIENLIETSRSELIQKGKLRKDNTSGYKGVSFYKRTNKWIVYIGKDKIRTFVGTYDTKEEAYKAYLKEERKLYGTNKEIPQC